MRTANKTSMAATATRQMNVLLHEQTDPAMKQQTHGRPITSENFQLASCQLCGCSENTRGLGPFVETLHGAVHFPCLEQWQSPAPRHQHTASLQNGRPFSRHGG